MTREGGAQRSEESTEETTPQMPPADPRQIVVKAHDTEPDLVYLDTHPDLAQTMGRFQPARSVRMRGASYVLGIEHLRDLGYFARLSGLHVLDLRHETQPRSEPTPYGRERALPECSHCGQPAKRGYSPDHCPNCGEVWRSVEVTPYAVLGGPVVTCPRCSAETTAGYPHCGKCGAPLPAETRRHRVGHAPSTADPVSLTEALAEFTAARSALRADHPGAPRRRKRSRR